MIIELSISKKNGGRKKESSISSLDYHIRSKDQSYSVDNENDVLEEDVDDLDDDDFDMLDGDIHFDDNNWN